MLIGLLLGLLALVVGLCLSRASAEQAPQFAVEGFSLGDLPLLKVEPVLQPLPPLKYGFADYEAEPVSKQLDGFYLAQRILFATDLRNFFEKMTLEYPTQGKVYLDAFTVAQVLEYLNENLIPEQDGKKVPGYYALPSAEDIIQAVFPGRKCVPDAPVETAFKLDGELLSTRFTGNIPMPVNPDQLKPPSEYPIPKMEARRELLMSLQPDSKAHLFAWPDIRRYKDYANHRNAYMFRPLHFKVANVGHMGSGIRIKFVVTRVEAK
ncbi:MAG: hypothetical protein WC712_14850 [Candidatus Brocadiia bacterium]